jgi:hypothetical protein
MTRQTTYPVVCEKCGTVAIATIVHGAQLVCSPCVERNRRPQGEQDRLFAPAPTQITGQMTL